jgi:hypothetical protein
MFMVSAVGGIVLLINLMVDQDSYNTVDRWERLRSMIYSAAPAEQKV